MSDSQRLMPNVDPTPEITPETLDSWQAVCEAVAGRNLIRPFRWEDNFPWWSLLNEPTQEERDFFDSAREGWPRTIAALREARETVARYAFEYRCMGDKVVGLQAENEHLAHDKAALSERVRELTGEKR